MKKVMIIQPVLDLSQEIIKKTRETAINLLTELKYEVYTTYDKTKNSGEYFLESVRNMLKCDCVYFTKDWDTDGHSKMLHGIAKEYKLEILYEIEKPKTMLLLTKDFKLSDCSNTDDTNSIIDKIMDIDKNLIILSGIEIDPESKLETDSNHYKVEQIGEALKIIALYEIDGCILTKNFGNSVEALAIYVALVNIGGYEMLEFTDDGISEYITDDCEIADCDEEEEE